MSETNFVIIGGCLKKFSRIWTVEYNKKCVLRFLGSVTKYLRLFGVKTCDNRLG